MDNQSCQKSKAFKGESLNGKGNAWGVEKAGGVVYECMFVEATARRLARLNESMAGADWQAHQAVLEREGFDLTDPSCAAAAVPC